MVFVYRIKTIFFVHQMFTQFQVLPLGAAGGREWADRKAGLRVDGGAEGQEGQEGSACACAWECVWGWSSQHRNLKT